jgi:hypothetical protein
VAVLAMILVDAHYFRESLIGHASPFPPKYPADEYGNKQVQQTCQPESGVFVL